MKTAARLSRQDIIDFASRYVTPEEITDFAHDNDLFCLIGRKLEQGKVLGDDEGWEFQGYGICSGYAVDEGEVPAGKWLWMHFISLATFPPRQQVLKLQPPHVVKGRFQNPDRTEEFRIIKISMDEGGSAAAGGNSGEQQKFPSKNVQQLRGNDSNREKVLRFRKKE